MHKNVLSCIILLIISRYQGNYKYYFYLQRISIKKKNKHQQILKGNIW